MSVKVRYFLKVGAFRFSKPFDTWDAAFKFWQSMSTIVKGCSIVPEQKESESA